MINGIANRVMPRLAIQSAVPRSSWTTSHRASKAPIIKNTPAARTTAPATTRLVSRSTARRWGLSVVAAVSSTGTVRLIASRIAVAAETTRNGAASPYGPTSTAEIAGPMANPKTSALRRRPRLAPRFSLSVRITTRRIAGSDPPMPMPEMMRPSIRIERLSPKAISRSPAMLIATPATMTRRA